MSYPWHFKPPWPEGAVRQEYEAGTWVYAAGAPACKHPRYEEACDLAQSKGWNPWWIRNWVDVVAVVEHGCYFDIDAGLHAVGWIESNIVHTMDEWAGKPFELLDWQVFDVVLPVFGWKRPDGRRRHNTAAIWIPKKNGKSGLASAIALYLLGGDRVQNAHVYCAATAQKQADIVHAQARKFVRKSPTLRKLMRAFDSTGRIVHFETESIFASLSSESEHQEGLNWSGLIIDELHVVGRALYKSLDQGGMARLNPLLLAISTAGEYDETEIGWIQWDYSQKVLDGTVEDISYFARIFAAGADDQDDDPAVWLKANPSMGVTFLAEKLANMWHQAERNAGIRADFQRYHLNRWVAVAQRWMEPGQWQACADPSTATRFVDGKLVLSPFAEKLRGRRCYGALDMSAVTDMTAAGLYFPATADDHARFLCMFFLPEENIVRLQKKASAPYAAWAEAGWLFLTPGNVVDDEYVRSFWLAAVETFGVREIAFDKWFATSVVNIMKDTDGLPLVEFAQTYPMFNPAVTQAEKEIMSLSPTLRHDGNPVLAWNMANAQLQKNADGMRKIVRGNKGKSIRFHVDGTIVYLMSLGRATAHAGAKKKVSAYRDRGAMFI